MQQSFPTFHGFVFYDRNGKPFHVEPHWEVKLQVELEMMKNQLLIELDNKWGQHMYEFYETIPF